jgi:hypothetical protein
VGAGERPDVHAGPVRRLPSAGWSAAPAWRPPATGTSVPCEWAGHRQHPGLSRSIDVATADAVVASHPRLPGSGQTSYDWQHYRSGAAPVPCVMAHRSWTCRAAAALAPVTLRHPGGDKAMAQVLAVVPCGGLEGWWRSSWCSRAWHPAAASVSSMRNVLAEAAQ